MRKYLFKMGIVLAILGTVVLSAYGRQEAEQGEEERTVQRADAVEVENLRIENYFVKGKNIQAFDEVPQRVVVIGETETETLMALGVQDRIAMAFKSSDREQNMRPENAARFAEVPQKTRAYINVEYVSSLRPDFIVAQQWLFTQIRLRDTDYWNQRGIKTFVPYNTNTPSKHIHPETIEKEMQYIEGLGRIFHKEERAAEIVRETQETIREIREKTANEPKPKVMFVEFLSNLFPMTGRSWQVIWQQVSALMYRRRRRSSILSKSSRKIRMCSLSSAVTEIMGRVAYASRKIPL